MNKRYLSYAVMATLCFLLLVISGCGSSGNKEGDSGSATKVSEASCITCHSTSVERLTGYPIVANYIASVHNLKSVGCQDCHGAGGQHQGKGPIPYASPNYQQCQTCHDSGKLVTQYTASKHLSADTEDGRAKCNRCHTHQGAVLSAISGYTGDGNIIAALVGAPGVVPNPESIKCNTCHDTHNAKVLRIDANWKPSATVGAATASTSNQFRLCTQCHGYTNPAGQLMGSGTAASGTALAAYHDTSWYRIIGTTHYDNPATGYGLASDKIEGYVLRHNGKNPCLDCHGHEAYAGTRNGATTTPTIYTDWAQSGHASGLLKAKYAAATANPILGTRGTAQYTTTGRAQVDAVMAAGPDGTSSWPHYDWDATNRQSCQRCHTSTGVVNFMAAPTTYDATKNDFRHLAGWTGTMASDGKFSAITSSGQNELLYCWGCHSDAPKGTLRTPGALTFTYTNNATVTYPNLSGSNVCMACHTGRETGESIKNDADADGVRSFLNSHYLAAGGQLFGTTGYEYATKSYANPAFFAHDKIGSTAAPGTGTNGPCVGCHMTTPSSHKFTNVTKSGGAITGITSTACVTCHAGNYALTAAKMTEEEEDYKAALQAAKAVMAGKGLHFIEAHPYWYKNTAGGSANAYTNWAGLYGLALWKDVMGAAFNINLLIHDPGGYAHNRYYVKRLLWDSLDFIQNGILGDIDMTATIDGLDSLTAAQKTAAKKYMGTARL